MAWWRFPLVVLGLLTLLVGTGLPGGRPDYDDGRDPVWGCLSDLAFMAAGSTMMVIGMWPIFSEVLASRPR